MNKKILWGAGIAAGVIILAVICIVIFTKKQEPKGDLGTNPGPNGANANQPSAEESIQQDIMLLTGIEGSPSGIAVMNGNVLLVTDTFHKTVWEIRDGKASLIAGQSGPEDAYGEPLGGYHDAPLSEARFQKPWGVAKYLDGWAVSDSKNQVIRYFDGQLVRTAAYKDSEKTLVNPTGLSSDDQGNLYIADAGANAIYKMDQEGILTMVADGFNAPNGVCYSNGKLYVADTGNHRICAIENGLIQIVAGGKEGFRDGEVSQSCFQNPQGVTVGEDGLIYVADTGNSSIRVIKDGSVKTLLTCSNESTWPVAPIALTPYQGKLAVADQFSGVIFLMPYDKN
ncbi:MAG: NHL repeat-containing protein [Lachnospiraceae bacterium]|nr:NHL repeat-containing protein [Lachnospiraceae bacterium]